MKLSTAQIAELVRLSKRVKGEPYHVGDIRTLTALERRGLLTLTAAGAAVMTGAGWDAVKD